MSDEACRVCRIPLAHAIEPSALGTLEARLKRISPSVVSVNVSETAIEVYGNGPVPEGSLRDEVHRIVGDNRPRAGGVIQAHHASAQVASFAELSRELRARGELIAYGHGQYGYTGTLLQVARRFDHLFRSMALAAGAQEYQYPTALPLETVQTAGYFERFPQHVWLLAHFRQEIEVLEDVARLAGSAASETIPFDGARARSKLVASPLVCFNVYQQLAGRPLPARPVSLFTATATCMRFEPEQTDELRSPTTFTMREIVALGDPPEVGRVRQEMLDQTSALAARLDLSFRVEAATDAFFKLDQISLARLQRLAGLKYELRVDDGSGSRPLAVSSFNLHGDHFSKRFRIGDPAEIQSGCIGFGLERWAIAFLARHGLDRSGWPEALSSSSIEAR